MKYFYIIFLFLFACDVNIDIESQINYDVEVMPYVREFDRQILHLNNLIDFQFTDEIFDNPNIIGHCGSPPPVVTLKNGFWMRATEVQKLFIVYHELGHCVLDRGHIEDFMEDGCPVSLMKSDFVDYQGKCGDIHFVYYINELRNNR